MKIYNKILVGYVIQTFREDGTLIDQEFVHGDTEWENNIGESLDEDYIPDCVLEKRVPVVLRDQGEGYAT